MRHTPYSHRRTDKSILYFCKVYHTIWHPISVYPHPIIIFWHYSVPQYRLTLHLSFICDTIWYSSIRLLCLSSVPLCRDLSLKVTHGVRCPKDRTPLALRLFTEERATARSRLRRGGLHDRRHREGGLWIPFRVRYCIMWSFSITPSSNKYSKLEWSFELTHVIWFWSFSKSSSPKRDLSNTFIIVIISPRLDSKYRPCRVGLKIWIWLFELADVFWFW